MFKSEFALKVRSGIKRQTIRPVPKRMPKVGDEISCRMWKGKPYRSKQTVLCEGVISEVRTIKISEHWITLDEGRDAATQEFLAFSDGFESAKKLIEWFRKEHGLPFSGIMIRWK